MTLKKLLRTGWSNYNVLKKKYDNKKRQILARLMIGGGYKRFRTRLGSKTEDIWISRKIRYFSTIENQFQHMAIESRAKNVMEMFLRDSAKNRKFRNKSIAYYERIVDIQ